MTVPVTTLADIVLLAHQQYGIRFQLRQQQLVDFVNMIQFIAYNQDMGAFENWDELLALGQDIYIELNSGTTPVPTDIGKTVIRDGVSNIGTLLNYQIRNRITKWIVAPLDGSTSLISGIDGSTLTISGGSGDGVVVSGQDYLVSMGPYRAPTVANGAKPFRKFIGITELTDEQRFATSPLLEDLDYGLPLNQFLNSRRQMWTTKFDRLNKEVTLVGNTRPSILQTNLGYGETGSTLNTSTLRWVYYVNPPTIESLSDESNLILPEEYRYEIIYKGISRLADTATYGDVGSVRQLIDPLCERFWEDMRTQYQAYGASSDWISEG